MAKSGDSFDVDKILKQELIAFKRATDKLNNQRAEIAISTTSKAYKALPGKFKAEFQRSSSRGLGALERDIYAAVQQNIERVQWLWPDRYYARRAVSLGIETRSPRDIIDTGKLFSSTKVEFKPLVTGWKLVVRNTAPYSTINHWGGYIKYPYGNTSAGRVYMPGRPFIAIALGQTEFTQGVSTPTNPAVVDYQTRLTEIFRSSLQRAISSAS